ncbi:HECT E3 ubiquitin ligase [Achlya hypogyna]|uniref:HECT-type E3 ubiquitin transferase n=1 Tax=Achlya hypogyna TaxID=1202772 RepID=A0A1V9ZK17_ACHHY|nr:HECT E3 ubiquitin ligase [Achlya hypogyna]
MGGRATKSIAKVAADLAESEFDLEAEQQRAKDLEAKHKAIVEYVVANVFPYAPVSVKTQRLARPDGSVPNETDIGKQKKQTYIWITVDDIMLKKQVVTTALKYPVAAAIDSEGNVFITDKTASQRKLKAADVLALANAAAPPPPPLAVALVRATPSSLTVRCAFRSRSSARQVAWAPVEGSVLDRFEVQFQSQPKTSAGLKAWSLLSHDMLGREGTLDGLVCHAGFGWSDFSAVGGPFFTLAGAPDKPHALFPAVVADTFINMSWAAVDDHGSPITAYSLEMREIPDVGKEREYVFVYSGVDREFVVAGLTPKTVYGFRLRAANAVGETAWLESRAIRTSQFARPEVQELPSTCGSERWVECWDPKQEKVFYFNKFTCQRTYDEPAEVAEARKATGDAAEESPEMLFRKKRFHFHRELRAGVPAQAAAFDVSVHRESVFTDSVERFARVTKKELWAKPRVTFHDEGGIDSGGLTKDWYLEVSKAAVQPARGLFRPLDKGHVEINPEADTPEHLKLFRFLGKLMGKAIFDRQVLALPLAPILFKHLVGSPISPTDLDEMDPQFAKSLAWIQAHDVTDVIYETFSISRANNVVVDLLENGRDVDVTEANKAEYVRLMRQWRSEFAVRPQLDALLVGLHTLVPAAMLQAFAWDELQLLLNGNPAVDVDQLRAHAAFQGGYDANAQVVLWLWQALRGWPNAKRQLFLKFATGSTTIPLDGFEPPFTLTLSDLEPTALPRSHTCFNQLVLPEYPTLALLEEKLSFAIANTEGFELS